MNTYQLLSRIHEFLMLLFSSIVLSAKSTNMCSTPMKHLESSPGEDGEYLPNFPHLS